MIVFVGFVRVSNSCRSHGDMMDCMAYMSRLDAITRGSMCRCDRAAESVVFVWNMFAVHCTLCMFIGHAWGTDILKEWRERIFDVGVNCKEWRTSHQRAANFVPAAAVSVLSVAYVG